MLHGIDFQVKSNENVGVIGRTGAGKSSIALSLFRILESSKGSISIDGVNLGHIGLHDVRSKISIVPQVYDNSFYQMS